MIIHSVKARIIRPKRCASCRSEFFPVLSMQKVCGIECAQAMAKKKREKAEKSAGRLKRESLKSRSQWLKDAQTAFNTFIRVRDADQPCISCNRHHEGQWHAGHYLSTGARPELRFDESNVHKQCQPCNTHLHGNLILYRVWLIKRIGYEDVARLEGPHEAKHYSIEDLKSIKAIYVGKLKEFRIRKLQGVA